MLLIRQHTPRGAYTEQQISDPEISAGRAKDCTVVLSDPFSAKRHVRVSFSGDTLKVDSLSPLGIEIDGSTVQSGELKAGQAFFIGSVRFQLSKGENDGDLILNVYEPKNVTSLNASQNKTALATAGLKFRRPALLLGALVFLLCLALPLLFHFVKLPDKVRPFLPNETFWLSGHISNAHASFSAKCGTCHESLFAPVRSEACISCHRGMAQHSDNPAILSAAFHDVQKCTSCHMEHNGAHALIPSSSKICTDCHAHPGRFGEFPKLEKISDFENTHPAFHAGGVAAPRHPVPLEDVSSGLVFAHAVHLDKKGVKGPDGQEVLQCASCHLPDSAKQSFKPVLFAQNCQRCHQLQALINGQAQSLPHGDNDHVRGFLELKFHGHVEPVASAHEASNSDAGARRRPGEVDPRGGPRTTSDLIDEVFDRQVCVQCHQIVHEPGKPIAVRPPREQKAWFPDAKFSHAAHRWVQCNDCHAATTASSLEGMPPPKIETCKTCHSNAHSLQGVPTTCSDCHEFHRAGKLSFDKMPLLNQAKKETR